MIDELERLAKLWQIGALTDEEFAEGKQRLFAPQTDEVVESRPVAVDDTDLSPATSPEPDTLQTQATQSAAEDDLLFDDLNAMLEEGLADLPPLDDAPAAEATPVAAPSPDDGTEPATDDDLLFDDLNAMLEQGLADLPPLDEIPAAEVASNAVSALDDLTESATDDDLLFDDLNAMLAEGMADLPPLDDAPATDVTPVAAPLPNEVIEPKTDDDLLFDDLNAMLAEGMADLPPLDDAPTAEVAPVAAPSPGEVPEPKTDDDLLFDDLNAMLAEGLADLPPLDESAATEAVPPPSQPATDDDLMFDDLNAMLAEGMADLPPLAEAPATEATSPVAASSPGEAAERAADDDRMFDDLNAMLDDGLADLPPLDQAPETKAVPQAAPPPQGDSTLLAHAERLADDLDMTLEVALPAAAPPEDGAAGAESEPAIEAQSKPKRARRKFTLGKIIVGRGKVIAMRLAMRAAKLPRPVLLGIGGGTLFFGAMGIGIALAFVTSSEPDPAETTPAESDESAEHSETAGGHGDEGAPDPSSPGEAASQSQLAYDADDVMRQCPAINAMSESFGTALAEQRKVPIQSLRVIERSGHVRTDAHAPARKSCLVAFEMKTGPRQCKVDAVVRFDDSDVGAHLGEKRRIICEGDAGFERNDTSVTSAEARHRG